MQLSPNTGGSDGSGPRRHSHELVGKGASMQAPAWGRSLPASPVQLLSLSPTSLHRRLHHYPRRVSTMSIAHGVRRAGVIGAGQMGMSSLVRTVYSLAFAHPILQALVLLSCLPYTPRFQCYSTTDPQHRSSQGFLYSTRFSRRTSRRGSSPPKLLRKLEPASQSWMI